MDKLYEMLLNMNIEIEVIYQILISRDLVTEEIVEIVRQKVKELPEYKETIEKFKKLENNVTDAADFG